MNTDNIVKNKYQLVAEKIIIESIRSAIFIDDKARPFFHSASSPELIEEKLTVELLENFKKLHISLTVHKFEKGNEIDEELNKYLFESRDLVLLDWKLDNQDGEEYCLQFLSSIVQLNHIHFCVIYTSMPNIDEIFNNIVTYFSSKNKKYYDDLKMYLSSYEDTLMPILNNVNLTSPTESRIAIEEVNQNKDLKAELLRVTEEKNIYNALKLAKFAFSNYLKSEETLPIPEAIDIPNQICVINHTIIAVLNKEADTDPSKLLSRISQQLTKSNNSFTQLLGFEMQSVFSRQSSFIDSNLLKASPESLLFHRNQIVKKDGNDNSFKQFIKSILIEHASSGLRTARLHLLENEFLDHQSTEIKSFPTNDSLFSMNVFYNSRKVHSLYENHHPMINFGDVFKDDNENYYICITALCDCYRPEKIDNNYFFAQGQNISSDLAFMLGDTGFVSFLPNNKVVSWVYPEIDDEISEINDPNSIADYYKQYKYKPIYIKPLTFNAKSQYIIDEKIEIRNLTVIREKEDIIFNTINYVTTIRDIYAQRIANHAFSHPLRVGVDFVKK